jgi:hypothetical protein
MQNMDTISNIKSKSPLIQNAYMVGLILVFFFVKTIVNNSKSLHIQNAIFTFSDIVKINTIFTMLAQSTKLKKQDKN